MLGNILPYKHVSFDPRLSSLLLPLRTAETLLLHVATLINLRSNKTSSLSDAFKHNPENAAILDSPIHSVHLCVLYIALHT